MITVVLSLGSNLGDREEHLRQAVRGLGDSLLLVSGVYETPPWGDADQPAYFNAVALVGEEGRGVNEWLTVAQQLERDAHRQRDPSRRFGPRTLDVDLITATTAAGEPIVSDRPELTLPHPRAHLRAFVLRPWLEIQPYASLPGHGWVYDLIRTEPVASDVLTMTARPEISLES
ncbi:MAG: 2-amino-4-hydroxy-6-hydroxymethyldihydropteridine diphosphokinase [Hamadaea sp.]|uniref:2-amino-4-hydroxy-6- hydroxymethyldihydropteridine diphosphokinase n=1 Tax=Hamadaea sp. TaxID=2024425 RepID=UPI00182D689A|nr:2-amino-4-hydroxy-6-hydroxymethyldihydropteridine diphosphokinase [Hamadaea sp.]NUR74155.1 2-amino-4-hydroxy-6-hydroxymethyldihydropteridine diphosphokinase [Hamadaea sp.]NUT19426.1 2-amino-4-hydroxy-6-hydroxymethyldihydropteridine diphosphokinase [Hamadaea sp.]